ncbi:hypothetical protein OG762_09795 [Streptomyces sp. NBC_01136]|uniref:hypothetical protein n=1 Tax=unclassified Streptomyces TaxID=2593676 RepID=UPI003254F10C|nr:hypothetical protein OG762_09795 [Streptomyces sp. NBC_01136]
MPIVFSYNNVPFEQLLDAFAGFMALPSKKGRDASYDPRTVRQRYDLEGESRIHVGKNLFPYFTTGRTTL